MNTINDPLIVKYESTGLYPDSPYEFETNKDYSESVGSFVDLALAEEMLASLQRLIDAAKPHCVPSSTLNMRVLESLELILKAKGQ